jgi:hypothetical protein
MGIKTLIGLAYQFAVEAPLATARLVPGNQENRPAPGVKSESHTLFAVRGAESQFLHVGMPGTFESVHAGPA